ncbi:MAG TPA: winged helix-turn-helix domain-containing protein [Solirubrobacterales bacterium]|nr:winged helix-turn-helix domain-containing protein [Solirubrobacterales bacterium]
MNSKHSELIEPGSRVWTGVKSRVEYLRRLSVVFAFDLRIKIVTELYLREMSPKQFYEEFGGGSLPRVSRHFRKLAEHGWLEFIRSETGGNRRGATEHFYRAPELAVIDNETWALVPYSMRVAMSWRTFKILAERVRDALKEGTLDARADSHLSWTSMVVDRLGWERIVAAVDAMFESIFEQQDAAKLRISRSGEKPLVATLALAAFESPHQEDSDSGRIPPRLVEVPKDPPFPLPLRVSKVFADELSLRIVTEANHREISVPLFHAEFGGDSIKGIRRRFKTLERIGWLEQVNQKTGGRRRSAVERFFRATGPAIFDRESWAEVPDSVKPTYSWTTFKLLAELVKEAIQAGTFEARLDSHLSWSVLRLDQEGWERVAAAIDALLALILEEKDRARDRIAASGEEAFTMTAALAAFESPKDSSKEP